MGNILDKISPRTNLAERYNQKTYWGRVRYFRKSTSPRNLLATKEQIEQAQDTLDRHARGEPVPEMQYYQAKFLVDSSIHPDTKKLIFWPCRLSAFVLTNLAICFGMLYPTQKIPVIMFWQVANQSLNVGVNLANANKSTPMNWCEIGFSYLTAVAVSCGVASGLKKKMKSMPVTRFSGVLSTFVPLLAVITAGISSLVITRYKEILRGISVYNDQGEVLGVSRVAGTWAVAMSLSRVILLPIPVLFIPSIALQCLERFRFFRIPVVNTTTNLMLIGASLYFTLPLAIGLFPPKSAIASSRLEPEFHRYKDNSGNPMILYYNKGL